MFNTNTTQKTRNVALATALLLVLMTIFSFTTLAFADPGNGNGGGQGNGNGLENAPGQSESQDNNGNGPENNNGNGPDNNNGNGQDNNNGNGPDNNNGNGQDNNNGNGPDNNNGNGPDSTPPAPTGTDVKYHANFVRDALERLVSVTLTITVKDGDGNTVETDEVTIPASAYHGNFFEDTFAGDHTSTDRALLDLIATFNWIAGDPTTYTLDHQSATGNGTVNVFTRGNEEIAPPATGGGIIDQTTGDGNGSGDGNNSGGNNGSTGSNSGNTGSNNENENDQEINDDSTPLTPAPTTTIGGDPVATTEAPAAETTADETLADIEEDAVPLADAPADPDVPQTGIEDNAALLAAMLLGSLAGLLALSRRRATA